MTEETIFAAALEKSDSAERSEFVAAACGADGELRRKIEALLAAHDRAGVFLERPPVAAPAAPEPDHAATRAFRSPDASTGDTATRTHGEDSGDTGDEDRDDALALLAPGTRPDSLGRVGHYEVLDVLGKGGFGVVFRAFDTVLERIVAVKMLAPSMAATSPARKRFLREARSSASVRHENVVQVHAVEESPLPYLVMEFIPGETLQQRLDRLGPLDVPEVLRIGRQIAEGLAAAHAQGLIHRDIKPSNILIGGGAHQHVKITDFGLARAADDASLTRSGAVAGTPMYMAPEQARGETLDHRADLFSLGSVLYVLLSGRPPFRAETTLAVLKRVAEDTPRPIREVIPEVPEWLCRIVEKLHAKNASERFSSAREVADVLADCEQQVKAHGVLKDYSRIPGGKPRVPRRKWRWAAAAVLLLALAGGAVLAWDHFYAGTVRVAGAGLNDGNALYLVDKDGVRHELTFDRPHRLRPGRYNLSLQRAGDELYSEVVSVGVGDRRVIEIPPTGVIRFELDDPATEILIDGAGGRQLAGTDPRVRERELPLGRYLCTFRVPGLPPRAERVIVRGDRPTVARVPAAPAAADGFVPLFNGKDLTGWKTHPDQPGDWNAQGGALIGRGTRPSHLFTERGDYRDFHLRLEYRIDRPLIDSGVMIRCEYGLRQHLPPGYEVNATVGDYNGSVYATPPDQIGGNLLARAKPTGAKVGGWVPLEVIALGPRITVRVSGQEVADYTDPGDTRRAGHIALQVYPTSGSDTVVHFRKIEIKELPAGPQFTPREREELALLKGEWVVRSAEQDGKPAPLPGGEESAVRFGEGEFELHFAGSRVAGTFGIDAGTKDVLLKVEGEPVPLRCSYRAEGDRLRLGLPLGDANDRQLRAASVNNLKQLALAVYNYHDKHGGFPRAATTDKAGKPLLSWRVAILPYVEAGDLYKEFKLDEPWDGPNNKKLVEKMPKIFATPGAAAGPGMTNYRAFVGPGTAFEPIPGREFGLKLTEIADGTSNTLLLVEAGEAVIWTKPDDLPFDPKVPLAKLGVSEHGINVAYCDMSTATLAPSITEAALRGLITRNGGEVIELPILKRPKQGAPLYLDCVRRSPASPFVVLAVGGAGDRSFATLAEAVAAAPPGGTVEVRGDGPFPTPPLTTTKALTIRAATGSRPVLAHMTDGTLLRAKAPLTLEGLEIRSLGNKLREKEFGFAVVAASGESLRIVNCRLVATGDMIPVHSSAALLELVRSEVVSRVHIAVNLDLLDRGRVSFRNCVVAGRGAVAVNQGGKVPREVAVDLTGNTFVSRDWQGWVQGVFTDPGDGGGEPFRSLTVRAVGNVFRCEKTFVALLYCDPANPFRPDSLLGWYGGRVAWEGRDNLISAGHYLSCAQQSKTAGWTLKTLKEWLDFSKLGKDFATDGTPRFAGGDLFGHLADDTLKLTTADFRLMKGSPGQGAGAGGKDLGADVDLVGPGEAFDRARKQPGAAVVQPLKDAVEARARARDRVAERFKAGQASKLDLILAEGELTESLIKLAEAEGDKPGLVARLEELVRQRQEERDLTAVRVKAGVEAADLLDKADARLAEAKARLAKVKAPPPPADPKKPEDAQKAWAEKLGLAVEVENSVGMKFRVIPPGTFQMGSLPGEADRNAEREGPRHPVTVAAPFLLGRHEVTQGQYQKVVGRNPSRFGAADKGTPEHPVETVNYDDAAEFCRLLSASPTEKAAGRSYRLPTEAEWEYACRAGTATAYSFGDDPAALGDYGWHRSNAKNPQPVGLLKPNAWGLYDMHGNVFEICADRHDYATGRSRRPPAGESWSRGGSWYKPAGDARSAYRGDNDPKIRHKDVGFRVVLILGASPVPAPSVTGPAVAPAPRPKP